MSIYRVTAEWTGFIGAPGFSSFFVNDVGTTDELYTGVVGLFTTLAASIPDDVTIRVPATVDEIDPATGVLVDSSTLGSDTLINCTGAGGYSAPSGACVTWKTSGIVAGRRVRGRTFFVPLAAANYEANGTLVPAIVTGLQSAAQDVVDACAGNMVVWSRPRPALAGSAHPIVSASVSDRAAILKSRRD